MTCQPRTETALVVMSSVNSTLLYLGSFEYKFEFYDWSELTCGHTTCENWSALNPKHGQTYQSRNLFWLEKLSKPSIQMPKSFHFTIWDQCSLFHYRFVFLENIDLVVKNPIHDTYSWSSWLPLDRFDHQLIINANVCIQIAKNW